jgi:hypothetical protein
VKKDVTPWTPTDGWKMFYVFLFIARQDETNACFWPIDFILAGNLFLSHILSRIS